MLSGDSVDQAVCSPPQTCSVNKHKLVIVIKLRLPRQCQCDNANV